MDAMYLGLVALLGAVLVGLTIGCDHLLRRDSRGHGSNNGGARP